AFVLRPSFSSPFSATPRPPPRSTLFPYTTLFRSFDRAQPVGELTVVSSIETLYRDILDRAFLNLLFQSIVVMLGTLGLLLIVRLALSRHLEPMAAYAATPNVEALGVPLKLRRKTPREPG